MTTANLLSFFWTPLSPNTQKFKAETVQKPLTARTWEQCSGCQRCQGRGFPGARATQPSRSSRAGPGSQGRHSTTARHRAAPGTPLRTGQARGWQPTGGLDSGGLTALLWCHQGTAGQPQGAGEGSRATGRAWRPEGDQAGAVRPSSTPRACRRPSLILSSWGEKTTTLQVILGLDFKMQNGLHPSRAVSYWSLPNASQIFPFNKNAVDTNTLT